MGKLHLSPKSVVLTVFSILASVACIAQSLRFTDTTYVNLGNSAALKLTNFTLEAWVKIEGYGSTTETGSGGITGVIPVITKGRAESESPAVDVNYFMGLQRITTAGGGYRVIADFEDNTGAGTSPNFPASSTGIVPPCVWTHIAVSFNSVTGDWKFYINGALSNTVNIGTGHLPETGSNINACIGSSLNTGSIRPGFFNGRIDEARIWDLVRTDAEVLTNYNAEMVSGAGLVGRWSFNEGAGTNLVNTGSAGAAANGLIVNNYSWVSGFNQVDFASNTSMDFNGVHDYVTFGTAPGLNATSFTLEGWIKIEGAGAVTVTSGGSDGLIGAESVIPIVAKGRGEAETPANINTNYIMGITASNILVADFEEGAGPNHKVVGINPIPNNVWTHVAATYGGGTWNLYINGILEKTETEGGAVPSNTSIQHASIGSALTSNGTPAGFFHGKIDEVRIWNVARSATDISTNYQNEITSAAGLIGRFGFNENCDTVITNSAGAPNGIAKSYEGATPPTTTTIHPTNGGPSWVSSGFNNLPPAAPSNPDPPDNNATTTLSPNICADVSDPNGSNLRVRFYGRPKPAGGTANFTLAFLPDTQFYTEEPQGQSSGGAITGGKIAMFNAQTAWVAANRATRNIVYVGQLGDCVQNGDNPPGSVDDIEWQRAVAAINTIESPALTGLPEGIPYGICTGNHDQTPIGDPLGTTNYYNQFFGIAHFSGRSYYGGHNGTNNDNHYQLFSASGIDFLVISLEYDPTGGFTTPGGALDWAESLVQIYSSRKVIVMTHYMISETGVFGTQGQALFNRLSPYTNVILFKCGHQSSATGGEFTRSDFVNGRNIYTILTDYQSRTGGGSGLLRTYEFNPVTNNVSAKTYSPYTLTSETDANSEFTFSINLNAFTLIGETTTASGSNACTNWPNLSAGTQYEWYAEVFDGENTTTGPLWTFTATAGGPVAVSMLDISAQLVNKNVAVLWATANEHDNHHFDIERSRDGIRFEKIGTTESKGNSIHTQRYVFMDERPFSGRSFYRLRQVDLNGHVTYSGTVSVLINESGGAMDIYPNPVNGPAFTISVKNKCTGIVQVNMYDLTGRQVFHKKLSAYNGIVEVPHQLLPGMYNVEVMKDQLYYRKNIIIK